MQQTPSLVEDRTHNLAQKPPSDFRISPSEFGEMGGNSIFWRCSGDFQIWRCSGDVQIPCSGDVLELFWRYSGTYSGDVNKAITKCRQLSWYYLRRLGRQRGRRGVRFRVLLFCRGEDGHLPQVFAGTSRTCSMSMYDPQDNLGFRV